MTRLRGFVHVSTAYTNCDHPRRALVHERVYTLLGPSGKPLDIDALAAELASLPPDAAEAAVRALLTWPASVRDGWKQVLRLACNVAGAGECGVCTAVRSRDCLLPGSGWVLRLPHAPGKAAVH